MLHSANRDRKREFPGDSLEVLSTHTGWAKYRLAPFHTYLPTLSYPFPPSLFLPLPCSARPSPILLLPPQLSPLCCSLFFSLTHVFLVCCFSPSLSLSLSDPLPLFSTSLPSYFTNCFLVAHVFIVCSLYFLPLSFSLTL